MQRKIAQVQEKMLSKLMEQQQRIEEQKALGITKDYFEDEEEGECAS